MTIVKRTIVDKIEVLTELGNIQVRTATWFEEDGVATSERTYHRFVKTPLCDCLVHPATGESYDSGDVVKIASVIHTPEKKAEAQAIIDAR